MTKATYDRMQIAAIEGLSQSLSFSAHKINMRAKTLAFDPDNMAQDSLGKAAAVGVRRARAELSDALAAIICDLGVIQSIINSQEGEL